MTLTNPERQFQHADHDLEMLELARDLIDPNDVVCPACGLDGHTQSPIRIGRDGALERIDYLCRDCLTLHPIWIG